MGWKISMVIINTEEDFDKKAIFDKLGYYDLKKTDTEDFYSIMNPNEDKIYIGKYNGNIIICMQDLPMESMDEKVSKEEAILSKRFPGVDIATFVLHSVVNLWGYSITKDGKKIRARAGSSEGGTVIDYGTVLEEEKELFSQSSLNDEGERVFVFGDMPEDEFMDDQVGENFVFDLSERYLGENLDGCDGLFETQFEGYSYSKINPRNEIVKPPKQTPIEESKKSWWKFW
jgi:hypothetical protein